MRDSEKYKHVFYLSEDEFLSGVPYLSGWYFWAEDTASVGGGPFSSEDEAEKGLVRHCREVLGSTTLPTESAKLAVDDVIQPPAVDVSLAQVLRDKLRRIVAIGPEIVTLTEEANRLRAEVVEECKTHGYPITPDSPRLIVVHTESGETLVFYIRRAADGKQLTVTYERAMEV